MVQLKEINSNKRSSLILFLIIFSLVFIRYCYYGFHYYYQLDDYIQYHNFAVSDINPFAHIANLGLLANRPVAGSLDILFWSHFFPKMIIGILLISVMFAISSILFHKILLQCFGTGYIFLAIYALLPLGFEGTYWMAASTRIVVGLFFTSISSYQFFMWCEMGKKYSLVLYALFQLVSFGFYEQISVLSAFSTLLLAFCYLKKTKRALWALLTFVNAGVYFIFVAQFPASDVYAQRMNLVLPISSYYWNIFLPDLLNQLKDAFLSGGFYVIAKGFLRGAVFLFNDRNYLYFIGIVLLAISMFIFTHRSSRTVKRPAFALIVGVLLAVAPLAVFFIVANPWFSLRGTVASYCGIALIIDTLFFVVFSRIKRYRTVEAGVVLTLVLVFCIASISELHDYRETTKKDQEIVTIIKNTLTNDNILDKQHRVGILNLEPSYLSDQNYYYHEHIHGVTESSWALHGALECYAGYYIPDVSPLPSNVMYYPWNCESMKLSNFDVLYLYDGASNMSRIRAVPTGGDSYALYTQNGEFVGHTWEDDKYGYLELKTAS